MFTDFVLELVTNGEILALIRKVRCLHPIFIRISRD